jgi:2-iminobutanoate/2-iminopropanoate deaminase
VHTDDAPKAFGPYVQAKLVPAGSDLLYSSGVLGIDPKTMELVSDDVEEQAERTLKSIGAILKAGETDY